MEKRFLFAIFESCYLADHGSADNRLVHLRGLGLQRQAAVSLVFITCKLGYGFLLYSHLSCKIALFSYSNRRKKTFSMCILLPVFLIRKIPA